MTVHHHCADSAYPGAVTPLPHGFDTVQGYIGGPTPHVWSKAEWAAFKGVRKYPMWVASIAIGAVGHPVDEAFACLRELYYLGVPKGKVVGLDLETAIASFPLSLMELEMARANQPGYVSQFHSIINWGGYRLWVYGSASTVFNCPPCDGYDPAEWTGVPHYVNHANVKATQYADPPMTGGNYDARAIKWFEWRHHLWV